MTAGLELQTRRSPRTNLTGWVRVDGKFLSLGGEKFTVRGVTYGTFRPTEAGEAFDAAVVERDFKQMVEAGINTVRTYVVPPRWMLDLASEQGLKVMVGLAWPHHVAFLDNDADFRAAEEQVRAGVREISGHEAVLCYAVANEIPASIVRWHGKSAVERAIRRIYDAIKRVDPEALVTYVNYPSTEYLELPFLDLLAFNVYLEDAERYEAYLARLQNLAGERPLLMTEVGLDSQRNGEDSQAEALRWQLDTASKAGCAGAIVFAWTDEWYRGGAEILDWDFGLTRRDRSPKPALEAVSAAFASLPPAFEPAWPRISIIVCTYNGSRTLRDCLDGLLEVRYPDFEVIIVNDGSTDSVPEIVSDYPFRVIHTPNQGLSAARNEGLHAATGEIVAYTDDDARPDPDWLTFLAIAFRKSTHVGVGGPNIAPPGDGLIAECVANSPGGPVQVLLSDTEAEHIPGCNMAFRRDALLAINGFDHRYRTAGDDVDVCWRLQEAGGTLGFHAGAMVWHHRRNSLRTYWKQQVGYGRAEALLAAKWPERYNANGHVAWGGRLYGRGLPQAAGFQPQRIYGGTWGAAPFQHLYQAQPDTLWSLPQMPEWYLLVGALFALTGLGLLWTPLLYAALPLLVASIALPIWQAVRGGRRALFHHDALKQSSVWKLRLLTTFMHLMQPAARLRGRLKHGLTPWRDRGTTGFVVPGVRRETLWRSWSPSSELISGIEKALVSSGAVVQRGRDFDAWDLHVHGGWFAGGRLLLAVEEHSQGSQRCLVRTWPRIGTGVLSLVALLGLTGAVGLFTGGAIAGAILLGSSALVLVKALHEAGVAQATLINAAQTVASPEASAASSESVVADGRVSVERGAS